MFLKGTLDPSATSSQVTQVKSSGWNYFRFIHKSLHTVTDRYAEREVPTLLRHNVETTTRFVLNVHFSLLHSKVESISNQNKYLFKSLCKDTEAIELQKGHFDQSRQDEVVLGMRALKRVSAGGQVSILTKENQV